MIGSAPIAMLSNERRTRRKSHVLAFSNWVTTRNSATRALFSFSSTRPTTARHQPNYSLEREEGRDHDPPPSPSVKHATVAGWRSVSLECRVARNPGRFADIKDFQDFDTIATLLREGFPSKLWRRWALLRQLPSFLFVAVAALPREV
jgi:hypothetical protein